MKRIRFTGPGVHGGKTRRSGTDRDPGGRHPWADPILPAALMVCVFLFGCETQESAKPVGGGCEYRDIPGVCMFESITPSGANTYGRGFRTLFSFVPDSRRETSQEGVRMIIGDGKDPTRKYLDENRIEVGRQIRCIRKLRIRGPCSPEVFVFPGLKNAY